MKSKLIGKTAHIKKGMYEGHYGKIIHFDGDRYHINGGSIGENITPIFDRDEFIIRRKMK